MIRTILATVIVAVAVALTGCGGGAQADKPTDPTKADDAASLACEDFLTGVRAAVTPADRAALARKTNKWAQTSRTNGIAGGGRMLANAAAGNDDGWRLASDTFSRACLDTGAVKGGK